MAKIDEDEAVRLYVDEGLSLVECGKIMGRSWTGVRKALIRAGVDTSKRLGSGRRGKSKGRILLRTGYVLIYAPEHPEARAHPYVFEHRLVMEQHLGRPLSASEVVHHINGDRADNPIENLQLFPDQAAHMRVAHEGSKRWSRRWDRCQRCGTTERRHEKQGLCYLCNRRLSAGIDSVIEPSHLEGRKRRPLTRWARDWDKCQECGTTERRHDGHGLCNNCHKRRSDRLKKSR